jgi:hypothetical protein
VLTRRVEALPDFRLEAEDALCRRLCAEGAASFHAAARWVRDLPYGRNRARDYRRVPDEGRGTCSSKHALLAHVARAHAAPVELVVGTYEMDGHNTPGVGPVLAAHGLDCVLEAHCYLRHAGTRIDLTWARERPAAELVLRDEQVIEPEDVAEEKPRRHRELLARWCEDSPRARGLSPDQVWRIREACIAALGE